MTADVRTTQRAYPAYKDSGVEWLGEIPEHWNLKKLKFVSECLDGRRVPLNASERSERAGNVPYWGANGVVDYVDSHLFDEELVLLGEDGAPFFDLNKPVAFFVNTPVWPNNHVHVLRPVGINPIFFMYCLNVTDFANFIEGSTRDKLVQASMKEIPIVFPPLPEQEAIARFLDHKTAQIDALIAKKEALLARLADKRTALISQAVTKGLDPTVPMRDSGIEWLGEIPAHWAHKKLKYAAQMETGHTPRRSVSEYWEDCTIPWVSLNDTKYLAENDYISDTAIKISELGMANSSAHLIPESAVLFTRDATIGLSAITTVPMAVSQHIIAWVCHEGLIPEYLLRVFHAMQDELESLTMGSTLKTIGMDDVRSLSIPVPPVSEQSEILNHLDSAIPQIQYQHSVIQSAIGKLKQYRTALITNAVTGKIDVRDSALS